MQKRMLALVLAGLLLAVPVRGAELELAAPSAILMEASTGTVLYEKNAHERLAPASVTKVMTLLLVMEALESGRISWDDMVTASEQAAAKGGSQVYLEPGEQMTMEEMLKSVVVSSANDCATALAEHVAGSEEAFVQQMNERAAQLGMADTHFVNCTGLDDEPEAKDHLTSAYDLALVSRELLRHDRIRDFTTIWMDTVREGEFGLTNTNRLVRFYKGTTGLKTGYTSGAGHCLSASAQRDGVEYIAVVLHCGSSGERFQSARQLLDYGFANFAVAGTADSLEIPPVPVLLGTEETIQPVLQEPVRVVVDKGTKDRITTQVEVDPEVRAPVEQGQQLGTVTLRDGEKTIASAALVAAEALGRRSWWDLTKELLRTICFCAE